MIWRTRQVHQFPILNDSKEAVTCLPNVDRRGSAAWAASCVPDWCGREAWKRQSSGDVMRPAMCPKHRREHRGLTFSTSKLLSLEFSPFPTPTPSLSAGDSVKHQKIPACFETRRFATIPIR